MARSLIDGVLLLDKPSGLTSNAALLSAKRAFNAKKAGHTGTLDPLASGLLPLCFGEATKFASDLLEADKRYLATLALGQTTMTGDAEGEVLRSRPVSVDRTTVVQALERFRGVIKQIPPMYSALKRDGRPLYEYAREGITLERMPREIVIHKLELIDLQGHLCTIDVTCSKGTYIRVLAEDLGEALSCGAHLAALRRTQVGVLDLADAVTLDQLLDLQPMDRRSVLRPLDSLLMSLPRVELDQDAARRFGHGQKIAIPGIAARGRTRVYGPSTRGDCLIGVADVSHAGEVIPVRLIARESF